MTEGDEHRAFDPAVLEGLRAALGDDEILLDITRSFLAETPGHVSTLTSAHQDGDLRAVSSTAHLIKGSALTFGAHRLVALCETIEASPAEAGTLVAAVQQEYAELSRALVTYLTS